MFVKDSNSNAPFFICETKLLERAKINRFGEWKDITDLCAIPGLISCDSSDISIL